MLSSHSTPQAKPWNAIIDQINKTLAVLFEDFETAFAEGWIDDRIPPKEIIKRGLFRYIWNKLEDQANIINDIEILDEHYNRIRNNLRQHISDYLRLDRISQLIRQNKLKDVISENKYEMLSSLIKLYHALIRTRLVLLKLNDHYSPQKCSDKVHGLLQQARMSQDSLSQQDFRSYRATFIDPFKFMNIRIQAILQERGYCTLEDKTIVERAKDSLYVDSMMMPIYNLLYTLPSPNSITDICNDKTLSAAEKKQRLSEHVNTIRNVRRIIAQVCDHLITQSRIRFDEFNDHFEALRQVQDELMQDDSLDDVFRHLRDLREASEGEDQSFPALRLSAREAQNVCYQQSPQEKITTLLKACWKSAGENITANVVDILNAIRREHAPYDQCLKRLNEAANSLRDNSPYQKGIAFTQEWSAALNASKSTLAFLDAKLMDMESKITRLNETNKEYYAGFFKRNWMLLAAGALIIAGAAAALAVTLMTGGIAIAVMAVAGVVVGTACGAGAGLIREKIKPPIQAANQRSLLFESEQNEIDPEPMLTRLFGAKEQPVIKYCPQPRCQEDAVEMEPVAAASAEGDLQYPGTTPFYKPQVMNNLPPLTEVPGMALGAVSGAASMISERLPSVPALPIQRPSIQGLFYGAKSPAEIRVLENTQGNQPK